MIDIDKPIDFCPACQCGIWESMLSGRWLPSCNCKIAYTKCVPHNKLIEDSWRVART